MRCRKCGKQLPEESRTDICERCWRIMWGEIQEEERIW